MGVALCRPPTSLACTTQRSASGWATSRTAASGTDPWRERDGAPLRDDRAARRVVHLPIRRRVQWQDLPWVPASAVAPLPPQGVPDHRQRALSQPGSRGGAWLANHAHGIELHRLPPYSPELGAIVGVCKTTRRTTTHNRYFESPAERDAAFRTSFEQFKREPSLIEGHVRRFRASGGRCP